MDLEIIIIFAILTFAYLNLNKFYNRCKNEDNNKKKNEPEDIFKSNNLKIDLNLAKDMLKKNEFDHIIDIRIDRQWIMGHHPNAIHIPITRLESRLPGKIVNKKNKILVYAHSRYEAKEGAIIMKRMGYKRIKFIDKKYTELY